ncbi:hypothetical protein BDV10DRAFT_175649 [Aspergillus recurvatus]
MIRSIHHSSKIYAGVKSPQSVLAHAELVNNATTGSSPQSDLGRTFPVSRATQCALILCLKTYQILVSNGTPSFHVSSRDFDQIFEDSGLSYIGPDCWNPTQSLPHDSST